MCNRGVINSQPAIPCPVVTDGQAESKQ